MKMNNNKRQDTVLSIIVPVYNVEKYLKTCINSLLEQKLDAYEIILVDDGSTDSSGGICDEYVKKHEKIQVIHKKNGGLSSARNTGIENAVGKYIGFVDSDDYIMPEMYKNLIEVAEKCNAQMVMSRYFCFENQSDLEKISINLKEVKNKTRVYNTEDVLKEKLSELKNHDNIENIKILRTSTIDPSSENSGMEELEETRLPYFTDEMDKRENRWDRIISGCDLNDTI